jgi:FkbM family methyltransferase
MSKLLPRFVRDFRYRLFYSALIKRGFPLIELGNRSTGCAWTFCSEGLAADSIVYSAGVGKDITFEHALVKQFGCRVFLFDPSPTGVETMALAENKIPQFSFSPTGLDGKCGVLKFSPPGCAEEGSWSMQRKDTATLEVPCKDISTLLQLNGHDHIDLLKIDIEGCEYEVIEDLVKRRLPIRQLLVEFHHDNSHLPGIKRRDTIRAILRMCRGGYHLICQDGSNHTFVRRQSAR